MRRMPSRPTDVSARLRWLPAWVLIVGLALTSALGFWSFHRESDQRHKVLEREAREAARALEDKVRSYLDTLPGLRIYGMLQQSPTDAEFLHYVQALSLQDRYPGLNLSFIAELLSEDRRAAFEARARADRSMLPQGHPDFRVHPSGPRSHYMVLRHLYPEDPPAFGYDLYDPGQRYHADVDLALATGRYVATGPLQLARDRHKPLDPALTSVVVRAALYRGGATPPTEAGRRANALGVVGIGFRMQPLVNSVLPPRLARQLRLRIVDEQARAMRSRAYSSTPPPNARPMPWRPCGVAASPRPTVSGR